MSKKYKNIVPDKRRVLFVSEASFASTGFGTIYRELISRIHASGYFRVAEFATDCYVGDSRDSNISWRFYPNAVVKTDDRIKQYNENEGNKFGRWRFERVLLDFEPDIVIDLRDPPFFQFEHISPLRPYFHWCIGPTVDSAPQPADWIDMFLDADSVMPYTEFGYKTLKEEHPKINAHNGYGPGINLDLFKPMDKAAVREKYGISKDIKILGYVSRNQIRKRFPELLKAFKKTLLKLQDDSIFLHFHTALPDLKTWNMPKLLIEEGLYNKVFFTYLCAKCSHTFLSLWQGGLTGCPKCNRMSAVHPMSGAGCTPETMAEIHNLYDMYIQYSNCEGLGVGILEAAACGTPFAAINYSAMKSLIDNLKGAPINYSLSRDIKTDADRAIPDIEHTVDVLCQELKKPSMMLRRQGAVSRKLCEARYDWDKISNKWIEYLKSIILTGSQGRWSTIMPKTDKSLENLYNTNAVLDELNRSLVQADRADLIGGYFSQEIYARNRYYRANLGLDKMPPEAVNNLIKNLATDKIYYNEIKDGKRLPDFEDYIQYADIKETKGLAK